ncbi:DUF2335 domain-containing protein [Thermus brockianus]|uniref:DUF2335 domain-containing protein n=1 Tax=Thermus caliditerrae TaxID=1330700 RepID=A0A7C5VJB7_9DEIN
MSEEKDQRKETLEESSVDAPIYPEAVNLENQPPNNTKLGPVAQLAYYKGPLPDPFTFKAYGQVLPDAPDRILRMAEQEQKHRHELEKKLANTDSVGYLRGQLIAFVLTSFLVFLTYDLLKSGQSLQGYLFGGAGLVAIVLAFLRNRYTDRESSPKEKEPPNDP